MALLLGVIGCGGGAPAEPDDSAEASSEAFGPFVLGDLVDPFETPATLEGVDELTGEWSASPIRDMLAWRREQSDGPPAELTVAEALEVRNDSDEANREIIAALSPLPPESGEGVDDAATLNCTIQQDLRAINPILYSSVAEAKFHNLFAINPFTYDRTLEPCADADVVAEWWTSADRMIDKVVLRDDLVWSDGTPITAHDVEFSFKVIMSSATPVPAMRSGRENLAAVKAYDDRTVVYFHKEPLATNVWNLNFYLIPEHVYGESIAEDPTLRKSDYHAGLEREPVSGGKYEMIKRTRGSEILLRRRESYYTHDGQQVRQAPYFAQVRLRVIEDQNTQLLALKAGDVDEALLGAEQWLTQTGGNDFYRVNTKARGAEWTYFYIGWNLELPYFQDVRVRRALAYALDYREMIDDLCYGLYPQCHGIFHPDSWMFPKDAAPLYEQDLDKAEDLLDEAGWDDSDGDGVRDKEINGQLVPFEFSLIVSNKPDRVAVCNLFRENLDSIGILCNVVSLEAAVLQERVFKKNFQAEMAGWATGTDPYTNENLFGTGEERNYGSYSNPEVDRLFAEAEVEFDREKRAELYGRIHNLICEDQPYLFLYTRSSFYGFNRRLRGYRFSPRGPFSYGPGIDAIWADADY